MTKAVVAQRDQEQIALRRRLQNAGEIEKNNRQTAAAVNRRIAELQKTIASHEVDLSRSISINGLDERAPSSRPYNHVAPVTAPLSASPVAAAACPKT